MRLILADVKSQMLNKKHGIFLDYYKYNSLVELILQNIYNEKVAHIADI